MKSSRIKTVSSFIKGVFRGKRKSAVAMETYLGCIPSIQKLIDTHKLGINLKDRHVVIDASLHSAFIPKGTSSSDMKRSDRKYAAFFDKIVAYMNFQLGRMQKNDFIDPIKDTVTFEVTLEHRKYFDEEGNIVPVHLQVEFSTILVGVYRNGEIDYKAVEPENKKQ